MNLLLSIVLLQSEGGGMTGLIVPMVLIFAVMYFLIFRPQAKKQKTQKAMIKALQKGDKVVTSGGIYGTIVKIKISRSSVSGKVE